MQVVISTLQKNLKRIFKKLTKIVHYSLVIMNRVEGNLIPRQSYETLVYTQASTEEHIRNYVKSISDTHAARPEREMGVDGSGRKHDQRSSLLPSCVVVTRRRWLLCSVAQGRDLGIWGGGGGGWGERGEGWGRKWDPGNSNPHCCLVKKSVTKEFSGKQLWCVIHA